VPHLQRHLSARRDAMASGRMVSAPMELDVSLHIKKLSGKLKLLLKD